MTLVLSLASCEEFLDVAPKGTIDATAFFSNPDELLFALNGVYALQRNVYGSSLFYLLDEARSDNAKLDQTEQKERVETDTYEETPGNLPLVNLWTSHYVIINNANTVITRAPTVPTESAAEEDLVQRAIAEAKFIRSTELAGHLMVNLILVIALAEMSSWGINLISNSAQSV